MFGCFDIIFSTGIARIISRILQLKKCLPDVQRYPWNLSSAWSEIFLARNSLISTWFSCCKKCAGHFCGKNHKLQLKIIYFQKLRLRFLILWFINVCVFKINIYYLKINIPDQNFKLKQVLNIYYWSIKVSYINLIFI